MTDYEITEDEELGRIFTPPGDPVLPMEPPVPEGEAPPAGEPIYLTEDRHESPG